jgi:hypothetical protein
VASALFIDEAIWDGEEWWECVSARALLLPPSVLPLKESRHRVGRAALSASSYASTGRLTWLLVQVRRRVGNDSR